MTIRFFQASKFQEERIRLENKLSLDKKNELPSLNAFLHEKDILRVGEIIVRNYKQKTDRSQIDEDTIESAVADVLGGILSIREAAEKNDLKSSTLQHRIEKLRLNSQRNNEELPRRKTYSSKYTTSQKTQSVDEFYANYEILLARQNFTPDRILNFDETGMTSLLNTPKVLAEKKQRQVGQLVSAERDVSVFGPFEEKLKTAFNDWHVANAGKTITIGQIAELSKLAFYESFTPKNIVHGFAKLGIWPFNKLSFGGEDFEPCKVYKSSSNCRNIPKPQDGDTQLKGTTDDFFTQSSTTESKTVSPIRVRHTTPPCSRLI
ncbi:hypothetical protein JTB14_032783 [Gonioctena quinquepunctata]|nr:hypothetical protein JTB14_032783 [Gonioctena quinquepunctata]